MSMQICINANEKAYTDFINFVHEMQHRALKSTDDYNELGMMCIEVKYMRPGETLPVETARPGPGGGKHELTPQEQNALLIWRAANLNYAKCCKKLNAQFNRNLPYHVIRGWLKEQGK